MVRLKRQLTLRDALAIDIGAIIGAGIFVVSGLAAESAGPSAIISIFLGALIAVLTGLCYAQVAHVYAKEGGIYEYAKELFGNYAASLTGMLSVISSMVAVAAVAISFGGYFTSIFGGVGNVEIIAIAMVAVLTLINYLGIKHSARAMVTLTLLKIGVLAIFVIVGAFFIKSSNYVPFAPHGLSGIFTGSALVFFAYTGFARVTNFGEEVKRPKETIPKAILYSIVISCIIYLLVMVVFIGIEPYALNDGSSSPLSNAIFYATHNNYVEYVIAFGALIATVNVSLSQLLGVSRVVFSMARDKNLPSVLSRLNRFKSPDVALAVTFIVIAISIVTIDFKEVISLSNASALVLYGVANVAGLKLYLSRRKNPEKLFFKTKYFILVPILGIATILFTLAFLTELSLVLTFGLLIAITVVYFAARYIKKR